VRRSKDPYWLPITLGGCGAGFGCAGNQTSSISDVGYPNALEKRVESFGCAFSRVYMSVAAFTFFHCFILRLAYTFATWRGV
jgi:hypothetical protein